MHHSVQTCSASEEQELHASKDTGEASGDESDNEAQSIMEDKANDKSLRRPTPSKMAAARFVQRTEGVEVNSWNDINSERNDSCDDYEKRVSSKLQWLVRELENSEDCTGDTFGLNREQKKASKEQAKKLLMQTAMHWDPSETASTAWSMPAHDSTSPSQQSCNSNFCSTGPTGAPLKPNAATPEPRGDILHVAVQWEMDESGMQLASPRLPALGEFAKSSHLLKVPYRSMTAKLGVYSDVSTPSLVFLTAVVDSGAAQSAVSAKWLRAHPDLWDTRIPSPHRFHGITGENLQTDGVVRLKMKLGSFTFHTWAHVFVHMKSDMLLGMNAIIENALVIDGGDKTLCAKGQQNACVPVDYKLEVKHSILQVMQEGECVESQPLNKGSKHVFSPPRTVPVVLSQETVIRPTARKLPSFMEAVERCSKEPLFTSEGQALLFHLSDPMAGQVRDLYVEANSQLITDYGLQTMDCVMSSGQLQSYLPVANPTHFPITLAAGTVVGYARVHDSRKFLSSNDEGVGKLTFQVIPPALQAEVHSTEGGTEGEVTEKSLKEIRGLDLSDCRDLGKPGAPKLSEEDHQYLVDAFIECEKAIAVDPKKPGTSDYMLISINTGDAPPQASKPYGIPYQYQEFVREEIQKLLRNKLISPCTSSWASPVLVVIKKDHTSEKVNVKLACDVRKLNAVTEMDSGAIGEMNEVLDKFNGRPYASCCDISSGYYSFLIKKPDRKKLCFILPMSMGGTTFCWNRAPYGVAKLPAEFSRAIMTILEGTHEDISSYIDDLTVHTTTFKDHVRALKVMMNRLYFAGITLKGSKCLILPPRLELLGYDISPEGVHKQLKKCKEFKNFPTPTSREEVQKYLGGVQFYRRFVDNLATIAAPLTDLLKKKNKWEWTEKHQCAFDTLNQLLSDDIALSVPDLKDPEAHYQVFSDASDVAVSAILMQLQRDPETGEYKARTLAHFSKILDDTQRRWAIYEKESAALMLAVTNWRKYLLGRKFTCYVDSSVALTMLSKQRHTSKMQRWGMLLQEYMPGMSIGFKRSEENGGADSLSRKASFANYVPQPEDTMVLNDSLYDRLYTVDTSVRGKFGLHVPKQPIDLTEMWGVAMNATPDETIAMVESHTTQGSELGRKFAAIGGKAEQGVYEGLLHNAHLHKTSLQGATHGSELCALEDAIINDFLDDVNYVRPSGTHTYDAIMDHYAMYVNAFIAMHKRRPKVLCLNGGDKLFAIGCEMSGCEPITQEQSKESQLVDCKQTVPDSSNEWPLDEVEAVHAYGRHEIAARLEFSCALTNTTPVLQVDDGQAYATSFEIANPPRIIPQASVIAWKQCAQGMLCKTQHATCTEHSVEDSLSIEGRTTDVSIMHGQLLSAQMVAAYLHKRHGMPLWTCAEVRSDPTKAALLQQWSEGGYHGDYNVLHSVSKLDPSGMQLASSDEVWDNLISTEAEANQVRILSTPASSSRNRPPVPQPPAGSSYEERLHRYNQRKSSLEVAIPHRIPLRPEVDPAKDGLPGGERVFFQTTYPAPGAPLSKKHKGAKLHPILEEGGEREGNPTLSTPCKKSNASLNTPAILLQELSTTAEPTQPQEPLVELESSKDQRELETELAVTDLHPLTPITPQEQLADPAVKAIYNLLQDSVNGTSSDAKRATLAQAHFVITSDGLVKQRSAISKSSAWIENLRVVVPQARRLGLLTQFHTSPVYGHRGYQTLYELLSKNYYWSGMYSDCVDFVQRCEVCAVRKSAKRGYATEIKARPTPTRPFHSIALDIKG